MSRSPADDLLACRKPGAVARQLDRRRVTCSGLVVPLPALETVHTSAGAAGLWAAVIALATAFVVASVVAACLFCLRPLFKVSTLPAAKGQSHASKTPSVPECACGNPRALALAKFTRC